MKYCSQINHSIVFYPETITPCCVSGDFYGAPLYCDEKDINENTVNFKEKQAFFQSMINSEKIVEYKCSDCPYIEEKADDDNKYNLIIIKHWTTCNCNCTYCDTKIGKNGIPPKYNPVKYIEKLYKDGLIDKKKLIIYFQGGDIGVLPNFNEFIEIFEKNGFFRIDFCTNNIIYQPAIEKMLNQRKGTLCVSLDCGSRKKYKEIKKVDKFNNVIDNLKRYIKVTGGMSVIQVNYIFLQNVNDNKTEIKKFLKLMKKIGIKQIAPRLDHKYINTWMTDSVPLRYCNENFSDSILYFFKLAKKYGLKLNMDYVEQNLPLLKIFRTCKILKKKNPLSFKIRKFFKINK